MVAPEIGKYILALFPPQQPDQGAADGFQADGLTNHDDQRHDGEKHAVMIVKFLEPAAEIVKHQREVGHEQDRIDQQLEGKDLPARRRLDLLFHETNLAAYST